MPLYALKECGEETLDLKETLKYYFGYDSLRPGQQELMEGIYRGRMCWALCPQVPESLCVIRCQH